MRRDPFQALARLLVAAAIVATAAFCVVPLLAVATGAYASSPMGAGDTSRLLLLFLPQAVAVALPIATAIAVFFVCRRMPVTRQVRIAVGALTIATALVTAALNVSVAPVTNAMYRKLAFGNAEGRSVNGRRLNAPGEPGDRFRIDHRWTLPESVLVLAALAIAASRVAAPHARR
jgi:lipopolysaccharide export LptBFGC system permease protein LptF